MSNTNSKYKRLESLLSTVTPVEPNPPAAEAERELNASEVRVASLESSQTSWVIPPSQGSVRDSESPSEPYRQGRIFFGLRPKIILAIVSTTLLSVIILGVFLFQREAVTHSILGGQLLTTVREQTEGDLFDVLNTEVHNITRFLEVVADDVHTSASYVTGLFYRQDAAGLSNFWIAEEMLTQMDGGQWDNANSDHASVFIPAGTPLTQSLATDLSTIMHLNLLHPYSFLDESNMVAFYYITPEGATVYYPNIDLANIVPADFNVTEQIFYTTGAPEQNPGRQNIWTAPYQDPAGTGLIVTNVSPVYKTTGEFKGVLAADVQLASITERISQIRIAESGYAFMIDSAGRIIAMPAQGYEDLEIPYEEVPANEIPRETILKHGSEQLQLEFVRMTGGESGMTRVDIGGRDHYLAYAPIPITGYSLGLVVPAYELSEPVLRAEASVVREKSTTIQFSALLILAILAVAVMVSLGISRFLTSPLEKLTTAAQKISDGDLNQTVSVTSRDESALLASAFNQMTAQLRDLFASMQTRVQERTRDLELASEVGRTVTGKVTDLNEMLTTAAEMIRARFGLYYTQVYLTDPAGRSLVLRAGTGEVGETLLSRGHRLTIDSNSLNGRAVLEKQAILVADTLNNPSFKPNPLLPKTRSEIAIPLVSGERVLGVLDMQSEEPGSLSEANLPAFEALAGQLAIAIQNAELFSVSEQARAEVESQAKRLTRMGWSDYMNAIHKPERTAFAFDHNQIVPLEGLDAASSKPDAISVPIEITGETVGAFTVELESGKRTESTRTLIQSVAQQVARQVENLRLLDIAERYRAEAESITRCLTHEGWKEYSSMIGGESLGFAYDLEKVTPLEKNGHQASDRDVTVPLSVRDEAIGHLVVDQAMSADEARDIVEAVANQLSSHIENLRLSEQNERRAAELETAVNRLRELDRLKSSFLANMSHELRTPLNSILGFADVMLEELDGPLTENMQNDLGLIQKNGQHLLHLINDVLDMAKIEAGRMNLTLEKFSVHEILNDATSITSPLAAGKNLALVIAPDSDREVEITADRTRIRQVMINLINNSIKFTEKGSISIHVAPQNGRVLITVRDTGVGIPLEKLEDVFTEFAQVDSSATRKVGGTGLGLPISRRLVEMHGGRLWAESSGLANEGSTFYVELPLEAHLAETAEKVTR
jgi:signal transduction histidine kinase/putative methionine-R-sulfoxide reductase with GAF domain